MGYVARASNEPSLITSQHCGFGSTFKEATEWMWGVSSIPGYNCFNCQRFVNQEAICGLEIEHQGQVNLMVTGTANHDNVERLKGKHLAAVQRMKVKQKESAQLMNWMWPHGEWHEERGCSCWCYFEVELLKARVVGYLSLNPWLWKNK